MEKKDWKKEMKDAGFPHMDFVKSAKEGATRKGGEGWAYRVVIVDLEIRLPNGFFFRSKVNVEMDLLDTSQNPGGLLCEEMLHYVKKALKDAGEVEPLNLNQDWMKVLKDAGYPYMSYIKKAGLETVHVPKGEDYQAIVVYFEKEYSPGRTLRAKQEVDVALIKVFNHPVKGLCVQLKAIVEAMDMKAARDEETRAKA